MSELKPQPIRQCWDDIKKGVAALSVSENWRPEDVYAECLYGGAVLYTAPEGFVVLKEVAEEYTGRKAVLIWLAYGRRDDTGESLVEKYMGQIEAIARKAGAQKLTFGTKRAGYARLLDANWTMKTRIYERAL